MFLILLTSLLSLTTALQWTDSLTNNTVLTSCSSSDLHLAWNLTLSPEERVEDIKWVYRAEGGSEELIAMLAAHYFNPMPAFHGRVQWVGPAGIVVRQVRAADSGHYSVVVSTADEAHPLVTFSKSVQVLVADQPATENGELQVRQGSEAVYDNTTGQWRVQLSCGVFTSLGQPAVHPVWMTPEGHTMESSSQDNGTFSLLLPNPPSGGNYTCTLPPLSPAVRCLPPLSPLLEGATVTLDEVKTSFTFLDARQRETERQQQAQIDQMKSELKDMKDKLATATLRVSFHAMLTFTFSGSGTLKPFTVVTNEGQAFNGTSGVFTAPVNGTYFVLASAGTLDSGKWVSMALKKDGVDVSRAVTHQYSAYNAMGSVQATLGLTTGQQVLLDSDSPNGSYHYWSTSFTGFLIHADQ